jgi:hypothetical protein
MDKSIVLVEVLDKCAPDYLQGLFDPIINLPADSTKAEQIIACLNHELAAYGFKSYASPDRSAILVDDDTMSKVFTFFNNEIAQPPLTNEHVGRIKSLIQMAKQNQVSVLWNQAGLRKSYYMVKQYGFNGINLLNMLRLNTQNAALARTSLTGAAPFTMAGAVALSWSASIVFATVENYIPNDYRKIKAMVAGAKWVSAVPIRFVEWTTNKIFGCFETIITDTPLPINMTETYGLQIGPKVEDLPELRKAVVDLTMKLAKAKNGGN